MQRISFVIVLISGLALGCGTSGRRLARETLVQTVEYENGLRRSASAITSHLESIADLEDRVRVQGAVDTESAVNALAMDFADRSNTSAFRDADFRDFVQQAVALEAKGLVEAQTRVAELEARRTVLVKGVSTHEAALRSIRQKLEKLQEAPSLSDRAQHAVTLYEDVQKKLKSQATE